MNKLLALATKYVEGAAPAASSVAAAAATEPEELPFYFQSNAAAANAAAANAPAAAAANAPAAAPSAAPAAKLNNWNRHVTEVLQQMREAKWKNPNTGKNATRRNAMKEASRRKAETNSNYAAKAASRREKRNKQLAKKGLSAVAEVPAAAVVASNLPAATSGNLVAAAPASAALAAPALAASAEAAAGANVAPPLGPPRKGNGRPPPSFYQKFKAPSVPIIQAPPPGQQESRLYHNWNPPTITNVYSTQAPAQRQARSLQRSIDGAYAHPSWQAHWKKKINNLKPAINAEVAAGIKLEND